MTGPEVPNRVLTTSAQEGSVIDMTSGLYEIQVWDYDAEQWETVLTADTQAEAVETAYDHTDRVTAAAVALGMTPGNIRVTLVNATVWEM